MIVRSLFAAFALVATAAPALAQEAVQIEIGIGDLDLTQQADRERLDIRVKSAARNACRSGYEGPGARAAEQRCIDQVIASAQARFD